VPIKDVMEAQEEPLLPDEPHWSRNKEYWPAITLSHLPDAFHCSRFKSSKREKKIVPQCEEVSIGWLSSPRGFAKIMGRRQSNAKYLGNIILGLSRTALIILYFQRPSGLCWETLLSREINMIQREQWSMPGKSSGFQKFLDLIEIRFWSNYVQSVAKSPKSHHAAISLPRFAMTTAEKRIQNE
jgi:hypothetical protein